MAKSKYAGVTPVNPESSNPFWQYRIKIKNPDGKTVDTKIRKDSNGKPFLTARAAHEAKIAHESRIRTPAAETPSEPLRASLSDVYNNYVDTEGRTKAAGTIRKQTSMWENHIQERFGHLDINSITIIELTTFLDELYLKYSYAYVEGFLKFFYLLYGHAARMEIVDSEKYQRMFVMDGTRLRMPKKRQSPHPEDEEGAVVYSDEEIEIMEKVLKDSNLLLAFHLGLYCGLRISECFGLRWRDVDLDNKVIHVRRQLLYIDGCWHLSGLKTINSIRDVYITEEFKTELKFYHDCYVGFKKKLKEAYRDNERVYDDLEKRWLNEEDRDFVNRKMNGELLTSNSVKYWTKQINPALKKHAEDMAAIYRIGNGGIHVDVHYKEFKYHSLRKTFGTRCASRNMPIFALMSLMGHSKIDTTKKYYINISEEYMVERTKELLGQLYIKNDEWA